MIGAGITNPSLPTQASSKPVTPSPRPSEITDPAAVAVPAGTEKEGDVMMRRELRLLRRLVVVAGVGWALLFILIGVGTRLHLYGDGAIFAYAVAAEQVWAFHWHNIAPRLAVYALSFLPAETYVAITGHAAGGVAFYGLLHFAAPLAGLAGTYAADHSQHRIVFAFACLSTAVLCPLVFGFPTEMWMAHTLFWPALATCLYARSSAGGIAAMLVALTALALTHEGALILAAAILATAALPEAQARRFPRIAAVFLAAIAVWVGVKFGFPPDAYISAVLGRAALNFINPANLECALCLLLIATLTSYATLVIALRRLGPRRAPTLALAILAASLVVYWIGYDRALHTEYRYFVRTALLVVTPVLGLIAAACALQIDGNLRRPLTIGALSSTLLRPTIISAAAGALILVTLVHGVETMKFVAAWMRYKAEITTLATGTLSDPALGDPRFVSSGHVPKSLERLAWSSTTPYLSVLVAPGLAPSRLVVDPGANYFWLSCRRASASYDRSTAVPEVSRDLVRRLACLHR